MVIKQYEIYWVNLDPTIGSEIKKTRPCIIISPDVSNKHLNTILIAPVTSTIRNLPMRFDVRINRKKGNVCLDQIRCIDKSRLTKKISKLSAIEIETLKSILREFLID